MGYNDDRDNEPQEWTKYRYKYPTKQVHSPELEQKKSRIISGLQARSQAAGRQIRDAEALKSQMVCVFGVGAALKPGIRQAMQQIDDAITELQSVQSNALGAILCFKSLSTNVTVTEKVTYLQTFRGNDLVEEHEVRREVINDPR